MTTTFAGHLPSGDHASRPAAGDVPEGALYACDDHPLIYQSNGSTWSTWATLGSAIADIVDIPTAETDDTLVLAPDGAGGVEFRAETGGGGGAPTITEYGYETLGASDQTMVGNRTYLKKFTTGAAGIVVGARIYLKETTDSIGAIDVGLFADNAGAVGNMISSGKTPSLAPTKNASFASDFRWFSLPIPPTPVAAATSYWFGWMVISELSGSPAFATKYDAGSDRYWDASVTILVDGGRFSDADSTRKFNVVISVLDT